MQTTIPLQNEAVKTAGNNNGKSTTNPLQLQSALEDEALIQKKENPIQIKTGNQNPLQLKQPANNPLQSPIQLVRIRAMHSTGSYRELETDNITLEELKELLLIVHPSDKKELQNAILEKWKERVRTISKSHKTGGPDHGMPEQGAYNLIELGPFRQEHPDKVSKRTEMDPVSTALGLSRNEEEALYRYSQGNKDEKASPGYMSTELWQNLETAVQKIPSMRDLGIVATVFRADRKADFTEFLKSRNGKPCYIIHGATVADSGIKHLASAAFTVNSHGMREEEAKPKGKGMQLGKPKPLALTRIICTSARYIQYWGMHGASLDGGEVLIPAGTITYYDGNGGSTEKFGGAQRLIFTLVEVTKEIMKANPAPSFDDFRGKPA